MTDRLVTARDASTPASPVPSPLPSSRPGLFARILAALRETDPDAKCVAATALWGDWQAGGWSALGDDCAAVPAIPLPVPGRPARPELVPPAQVPLRGVGTREGRGAMLHAVAHIEFNAINLALDAAFRFRGLPADYYGGWLQVAAEEALHFGLIRARLRGLDYDYGDFPAHNGLWELALKTADDPLARMALVPRLMEARGLDATPPILARFRQAGDAETVAALEVILRDEVGHVALGDRWFRHLCGERGLPAEATYRRLLDDYRAPRVKPPFNTEARLAAGFSAAELADLAAHAAENNAGAAVGKPEEPA